MSFCLIPGNPNGECISSVNSDALAKAENAPFRTMLSSVATQNPNSDGQLSITLLPGLFIVCPVF